MAFFLLASLQFPYNRRQPILHLSVRIQKYLLVVFTIPVTFFLSQEAVHFLLSQLTHVTSQTYGKNPLL